jgi:hypothetical protein
MGEQAFSLSDASYSAKFAGPEDLDDHLPKQQERSPKRMMRSPLMLGEGTALPLRVAGRSDYRWSCAISR